MDVKKILDDEKIYKAICRSASRNHRTPIGELRAIVSREMEEVECRDKAAEQERLAKELEKTLREEKIKRMQERIRIEKERDERMKLRAEERKKSDSIHLTIQKQKEERRQARLKLAQDRVAEAKKWKGIIYEHGFYFAVAPDPIDGGILTRQGKGKKTAEEAALAYDDAIRPDVDLQRRPISDLNFPHLPSRDMRAFHSINSDLMGHADLHLERERAKLKAEGYDVPDTGPLPAFGAMKLLGDGSNGVKGKGKGKEKGNGKPKLKAI